MPKKKKEQEPVEETLTPDTANHDPPEPEQEAQASPGRARNENVLSLTDEERGITNHESEEMRWGFLASAYYRHRILTGVVSGVEGLGTNAPMCVVDYDGTRIVIPGHEMFMDDWPANQEPPPEIRSRLNDMLGATVEFLLLGVDIKNRAAGGSRREAMRIRRSRFYETGKIKEGILISCRVIRAAQKYLTVEALGVDTQISSSDASWQWFCDVSEIYHPGDLVVARVMALDYDRDTGEPKIRLSIKAAEPENPDRKAVEKLSVNSTYFGVVTGVIERMLFVRLQTGVNAKTMSFRSTEMPRKGDTVSFLVKSVDKEYCVAHGVITRIIKPYGRFR